MATKTLTVVVDDMAGDGTTELTEYETVKWSLDGKNYEFDTSPENAELFRNQLAAAVAFSRKVLPPRKPVKETDPKIAQVRAWAVAEGIPISDRGRIPADVMDAYDEAH